MVYPLDKSSAQVLDHLANSGTWIKPAALAAECGMSKRSIYYAIKKINEWLETHSIEPLKQDRAMGVFLEPEQAKAIHDLQQNKRMDSLAPEIRQQVEICHLMTHRAKPLFLEDFCQLASVSRNTVINDLKEVSRQLETYNLKLFFHIKKGYVISGDEIRYRALFFLLFPAVSSQYFQLVREPEWLEKWESVYHRLKQLENELEADYVSGTLTTLAVFLCTLPEKNPGVTFRGMDLEEVSHTREFLLVCKYFPELMENEALYLTLHLLGSRLQTIPVNVSLEDTEARELAVHLVHEFEDISFIFFDREEELIDAVAAHLQTSLYRYRYGIQLGNPMLDSIKTEYEALFTLTRKAAVWLEQAVGVHISDAEVAYLTLHFGAFITTEQNRESRFSILVICPNGIGTGNMLKNEIRQLVPHATEIRNIPLSAYNTDHSFDLVVSTVELPYEPRQVVVHPILTDQDRVAILRKCMNDDPQMRMQINEVCQLASKYMNETDLERFRTDLQEYYSSLRVAKGPQHSYGRSLATFLTPEKIGIYDQPMDWEQAIRRACSPLVANGSVTDQYVNAIIHDQKDRGLYMFLTDELVLAHSATEHGVNHVDVALSVFHEPVQFLNGKQVRVIIVLAAEDQSKHIQILNDIMDLFSRKKNLEKLSHMHTVQDILCIVRHKN